MDIFSFFHFKFLACTWRHQTQCHQCFFLSLSGIRLGKFTSVINCANKMGKYWIKNISRNVVALTFKLGTRKKQNHTCGAFAMALFRLQSLSVKNQITPFQAFWVGQRILLGTDMVLILSKLSTLDCWEWMILVKTKTGKFNSIYDKTSYETIVMATTLQVSFWFFRDVHFWWQVWRTLIQ